MSSRKAIVQAERRTRSSRLGFRLERETKALVKRAADMERRSLTDYCLSVLTESARRTIEQHERLVLSERDREAFFEALIHAPSPSVRLKKAFREYRRRISP